MDHRNLDKAMEIFACLITGETVGRENHRDLYEAIAVRRRFMTFWMRF